jgi:hypothetical protein
MPILNEGVVLQQYDTGIGIQCTIVANDGITPVNLTTATDLIIYIAQPNGNVITGAAQLVVGTINVLEYISQPSDLSLIGLYKVQSQYTIGSLTKSSEIGGFFVQKDL